MLLIIGFLVSSLSLLNAYPSEVNSGRCSNYCANDGVCLMIDNQPTCFCLPGWDGEQCDAVRIPLEDDSMQIEPLNRMQFRNDPCTYVPNLCKNGGICYFKAPNGTANGKLACKCKYEDQGDICEDASICEKYCLNGGFCSIIDGTEANCTCLPEWTAPRCNRRATTTTPAPTPTTTNAICSFLPDGYCNSGTCTVVNNKEVTCICPSTHTGGRCETAVGVINPSAGPVTGAPNPSAGPVTGAPNPSVGPVTGAPNPVTGPVAGGTTLPPNFKACSSNPCKNSRPCYNTGNSFFCDCGASYRGNDCSIRVSG